MQKERVRSDKIPDLTRLTTSQTHEDGSEQREALVVMKLEAIMHQGEVFEHGTKDMIYKPHAEYLEHSS